MTEPASDKKMPIYRVHDKETNLTSLIRANKDSQVRAHVYRTRLDIRRATQDDLVEMLPCPIETAGEEAAGDESDVPF